MVTQVATFGPGAADLGKTRRYAADLKQTRRWRVLKRPWRIFRSFLNLKLLIFSQKVG
jgi:hypothetical protein